MSITFAASEKDNLGSNLLSEVLSCFRNVVPHEPRPRRHAEPKLAAWSAPEVVKKSLGFRRKGVRKYFLSAADRGKHCLGRPAQAASPSMFSDVSMFSESRPQSVMQEGESRPQSRMDKASLQSGSRPQSSAEFNRDPWHKAATLFPVLKQSSWGAVMMKEPGASRNRPGSRQGVDVITPPQGQPTGESTLVPWKHSAKPHLFGRHPGDLAHPDSAAGHMAVDSPTHASSHHPAVGSSHSVSPDHESSKAHGHATVGPFPGGRKSIMPHKVPVAMPLLQAREKPGRLNKDILQAPYSAKSRTNDDSDDEDTEKKDGIWAVQLPSSKYERMRRLNGCRKLKLTDSLGDRDKVVSGEELEHARDSFFRYFKSQKTLHKELLLEALNDFGIRARSRPEKLALFEVFAEFDSDELKDFSLKDFCDIIEEARIKLRACRFSAFFLEWRQVDKGNAGSLDQGQVMQLLASLKVGPDFDNNTWPNWVELHLMDLKKDTDGAETAPMYPLGEVEYFVQKSREYVESERRKAERSIRQKYLLSLKMFRDFRDVLLDLYDTFNRLDAEGSGSLSATQTLHLLAEFGFTSVSTKEVKSQLMTDLVEFVAEMRGVKVKEEASEGGVRVHFAWLLAFVRQLRTNSSNEQYGDIAQMFHDYDKDKDGQLSMKDICSIIQALNMQPRTSHEQESIAELLDACDANGSGTIDLEETVTMMIRMAERKARIKRVAENSTAEALGISPTQKFELRSAFESLDLDGSGTLSLPEICKAIQVMQWKVKDSHVGELFGDVDTDKSGSVNFVEFMQLMSKIDNEINAEAEGADQSRKESESPPKETQVIVPPGDPDGSRVQNDRKSTAAKKKVARASIAMSQASPAMEQIRRKAAARTSVM